MLILITGLLIFFTVHSISIVNESWRDSMVDQLGISLWRGLYSLVATIGLLLIIWGYVLARQQPLLIYPPSIWLHRISLILLIPVFPLILATWLPGNIKAKVKHPMLLAIKIWALAHLLSNGMFSDVILFGSFLIWSIINLRSMQTRRVRTDPNTKAFVANDTLCVTIGIGLYILVSLWLHDWLVGVPPTFI